MNFKALRGLLHYATGMHPNQRQFGKTQAAAKLTEAVQGILICMNAADARRVREEFGVPTASIESYNPMGQQRPMVFDQDALIRSCLQVLRELDVTEAALHMATETAGMWSRKYAAVEESRDLWRRTAGGLQVSYEACCKRANKAEKERDEAAADIQRLREKCDRSIGQTEKPIAEKSSWLQERDALKAKPAGNKAFQCAQACDPAMIEIERLNRETRRLADRAEKAEAEAAALKEEP